MTDNIPPTAPALAFDYTLMVPAPDGVDGAIAEVMGAHQAEFDAALEPFGVTLDDLAQATWMRFVRIGDVRAAWLGNGASPDPDPEVRIPAPDGVYATDQLRDPEPFGERIGTLHREPGTPMGEQVARSLPLLNRPDACASGEACGERCSAVPEEVGYCSAYREADRMSCLFREGHTGAHDYSRRAPRDGM